MDKQNNAIKINKNDNCAVALLPLEKGTTCFDVNLIEDIPKGHKFALVDLEPNDNIIKYAYPIGHATKIIKKGSHIHTHNIKTNLSDVLEYTYKPKHSKLDASNKATFKGFLREGGSVGIRNEIWIINTVGCVNKIAERIADLANQKFKDRTDGIFTFVHPFGCSQLGDDHTTTQLILKNMVNHPNAAAVLVLGLGCENNNIKEFKKVLGNYNSERVKFLVVQDVLDEVDEALKTIESLVCYAEKFKRTDVSIDNLIVGLKCGGSDGLSGITANPLVGCISDKIISYGGSTVLTEVPEMFGAETILMDRCINNDVYNKTVSLVNDYKNYFTKHDQVIYENPSPGNKDGGISTLEDKSLGCTQKSGNANVVDVLNYGDVVTKKGLNLLNGPGNDIVAITNLMAAHAHIILFTTGRGTPVGSAIPTVKISSNTFLYNQKKHWIDFDAGILTQDTSIVDVTNNLFEYIIDVAEGTKKTNNEIYNYREISIFKDGVVL